MVIYTSPVAGTSKDYEGRIIVDESDYRLIDEKLPFESKDVVRIRAKEKFSKLYECFDIIGEGKFGKVYLCRERETGLELAAKRIKIKRDADRRQVEKEVAIMTQMRHPRIAQIYDAFSTPENDVVLVMEVVPGGELFDRVVQENYILTELAVVMIICQLCEAVEYIHSKNIVHLDIKPENIMCVSQTSNRIKLIDFGLAQYYDGTSNLLFMAGTPEFVAPEVVKFEPIDFHTDMWSIGVITYILLSGISPFLGDTLGETYCAVEKGDWEFDEECFEGISEEAKDFISKLLVYDQKDRMLPEECLQHQWIVQARSRTACESPICEPDEGRPIPKDVLRSYVKNNRFRRATWAVLFLMRFKKFGNVNWAVLNKLIDQDNEKLTEGPKKVVEVAVDEKCSVVHSEFAVIKGAKPNERKRHVEISGNNVTIVEKMVERPTDLRGAISRKVPTEGSIYTIEVQKEPAVKTEPSHQKGKSSLEDYCRLSAQCVVPIQERQKCTLSCMRRKFECVSAHDGRTRSAKKVLISISKARLKKTIYLKKPLVQKVHLHSESKNEFSEFLIPISRIGRVSWSTKLKAQNIARNVKPGSLLQRNAVEAKTKSTDMNNNATRTADQVATKAKKSVSTRLREAKTTANKCVGEEKENPAKMDKAPLGSQPRLNNQQQKAEAAEVLKTLNEQNARSFVKVPNNRSAPKEEISTGGAGAPALGTQRARLKKLGVSVEEWHSASLEAEQKSKQAQPDKKSNSLAKNIFRKQAEKSEPTAKTESKLKQSLRKTIMSKLESNKESEKKASREGTPPKSLLNSFSQNSVAKRLERKMDEKTLSENKKALPNGVVCRSTKAAVKAEAKAEKNRSSELRGIPVELEEKKQENLKTGVFETEVIVTRKIVQKKGARIEESEQKKDSLVNSKINQKSSFVNREENCGCEFNVNSVRRGSETIKADEKTVRETSPKKVTRKAQSKELIEKKKGPEGNLTKANSQLKDSPDTSGVANDPELKRKDEIKPEKVPKPKALRRVREDIAKFRISDGKSTGVTAGTEAKDRLKPDRVEIFDADFEDKPRTTKRDSAIGLTSFDWLRAKLEARLKARPGPAEIGMRDRKVDLSANHVSNAQKALNMWKSIEKSNSNNGNSNLPPVVPPLKVV